MIREREREKGGLQETHETHDEDDHMDDQEDRTSQRLQETWERTQTHRQRIRQSIHKRNKIVLLIFDSGRRLQFSASVSFLITIIVLPLMILTSFSFLPVSCLFPHFSHLVSPIPRDGIRNQLHQEEEKCDWEATG